MKAFTLLETLVTLTLLAMVTWLGFAFLLPAMRGSVRGTLRVEMQQQATVALNRLTADLRRTSAAGISLRTDSQPIVVAACPVSGPDLRSGAPGPIQPDGTVVWSDFFILYSWDSTTQKLMRREWPPGPPAPTNAEISVLKARRLTPVRMDQIVASPSNGAQVMAVGVVELSILQPAGGTDTLVKQPLRFKLVLERKGNTGHDKPERFTLTRTVFLRNQKT